MDAEKRQQALELIGKLRAQATGNWYWRCVDEAGNIFIEFSDYEGREAQDWYANRVRHFPDYMNSRKLIRVHAYSFSEKLMIEAADTLEKLLPEAAKSEWVVQDMVPVRLCDRIWWENKIFPLPASPENMVPVDISNDEFQLGLRHGHQNKKAKLHVYCLRCDLPTLPQELLK